MHPSSINTMARMFRQYVPKGSNVLDVGAGPQSCDAYRKVVEQHSCKYTSLDWGGDADIVIDYDAGDRYDWSIIPKDVFNCVISGQALEHDLFFWKTIANIKSVLQSGAVVILVVPSCGPIHLSPVDCYRYYPDCSKAFAEIMNANILEVDHDTESFNAMPVYGNWGDLAMAFKLR